MILTYAYGLWLAGFVTLYWLVVPSRFRPVFLLAASLVYLLYVFPAHTLLLFGLTVIVYLIGLAVATVEHKRKLWLTFGILLTLGVLCLFKYSAWVIESLNHLLEILNSTAKFEIPNWAIPLGISFFTFKFIHYLVDVYKGKTPRVSFLQFCLYMMFLPILSSGPIERIERFFAQTEVNTQQFRSRYIYEGIMRIAIGLFKKVVIADAITPFSDGLQAAELSSVSYWIAAYAFAVKIYMDFSGYSDLAIGSAKLFGYDIMENFNWPYLQRNLSLFWRNWHMSLTSWFKDYLFIPLGGSRVGEWKNLRNILIVWAATGIWHGAAWHFILWGLFHAAGLIILKYYGKLVYPAVVRIFPYEKALAAVGMLITIHYVTIGWVFFVCDWQQSLHVIGKMLLVK